MYMRKIFQWAMAAALICGDLTYRRIVELVHNSINDETPKNITY